MFPAGAPSRFDAALAVIGLSLLLSGLGAVTAAVPLRLAAGTGSLATAAAMLDALVVRPPE